MLPSTYGASSPTAKPRLREGGAADRPAVTYRELWENQAAVVTLAIELAADNAGRWFDPIPTLSQFAPAEREAALVSLERVMACAASDDLKRAPGRSSGMRSLAMSGLTTPSELLRATSWRRFGRL